MEGNKIPEGSKIMGGKKSVKELMDSWSSNKGARGKNEEK